MKRREFLHPHRLAKVVGPVLGIAAELEAMPADAPSSQDAVMLRFARRAMATTFEVILPFDAPSSHEIAQTALDEIDRLEEQLTVYRDTSEVSRLNARAAQHPVRVEANLFELLALAQELHRDTEGAFDISVGALVKVWGFFRRQGRLPSPAERDQVRERVGMQHVVLDAQKQTVHFRRQGLEINLGSIGKGHALDRAADLVQRTFNAQNFLVHGGHSSVLAIGSETPTSHGWTVGLTDPQHPERRRALLHLKNRALATSALSHQYFEHEGKKLGHLLDPRIAWPAERVLHATVTAPSAAVADALATAFFILGAEKARAYCDQHRDIGAVMIEADAPRRLVVLGRAGEEVSTARGSATRG